MGATHCSENAVRGTGVASKAGGVDDAVGVVLVASQVVAGSEVPSSCGVRHDISVTLYFSKSHNAENTEVISKRSSQGKLMEVTTQNSL